MFKFLIAGHRRGQILRIIVLLMGNKFHIDRQIFDIDRWNILQLEEKSFNLGLKTSILI